MMASPSGLGASQQPSPLSHPASSPAPVPTPNSSNQQQQQQQQQVPSPMAPPQPPSPMTHPQPPPSPMGPPMQQHPPPSQFQQQQQQPYQPPPPSPGGPSMGPPHQPVQQQIRHHHSGMAQPHYLGGGGYPSGQLHQAPQQPNYSSQPPGPMSQPMQQQPGAPPYPPDNINALQRAISTMEDRGLQDDPRYSALLAMRAKQGGMAPPSHSPGPPLDSNRFYFICLFLSSSISTTVSVNF